VQSAKKPLQPLMLKVNTVVVPAPKKLAKQNSSI